MESAEWPEGQGVVRNEGVQPWGSRARGQRWSSVGSPQEGPAWGHKAVATHLYLLSFSLHFFLISQVACGPPKPFPLGLYQHGCLGQEWVFWVLWSEPLPVEV